MGVKDNPEMFEILGDSEENIDLAWIIYSIKKRKKLLAIFMISGLFFSGVHNIFRDKLWEGKMQIVVKNRSNNTARGGVEGLNTRLLGAIGVQSSGNPIRTEVEILKSPSVLMPIFNYVKEKKIEFNKKDLKNYSFNTWFKTDVKVFLKPGTKVIDLTYTDSNKKLIVPVLTKISKAYQEYSVKNRTLDLSEQAKYLDSQVLVFKEKTKKSTIALRKFEIENSINEQIQATNNKAISEYKIIQNQYNLVKNIEDSDEKLVALSSIILSKDNNNDKQLGILESINESEDKIAKLKSVYKENHFILQNELNKKKEFIKFLKPKLLNYLISSINTKKALIEATSRDKDVLIKYTTLLNEAKSDAKVYNELSIKYRISLVEQAEKNKPWEMITQPTLIEESISISSSLVILIGIFTGLIFGLIYILTIEKLKDLVTKKSLMENYILAETNFYIKEYDKSLSNSIDLLVDKLNIQNKSNNYSLIIFGQLPEKFINLITKIFKNNSKVSNFVITKEIKNIPDSSIQIIISGLGIISEEELRLFNQQLILQNRKTNALILLDQKLVD